MQEPTLPNRMNKILTRLYSQSPVGSPLFLSPNAKQLHSVASKEDNNITLTNVKRFLHNQDAYTLNRSVNRNFKRNHYYVNYINDLWQIDLADVSLYAKQNDGYKYLLTVIDVLTKYAFVKPLKNKTAVTVTRAFRQILDSGRGWPKAVSSDKGTEFKNKHMQALLKARGINQQFLLTTSLFKASNVEIFNRTLKTRMFRYFTYKGKDNYRRYIDVLDDIVNAYNNTMHSGTRMKPIDIKPEHVPFIYHNLHRKHRKNVQLSIQNLQPGEYVRVVRKHNTFQQTFTEKWTKEVFIVSKVINKNPYKLYKLTDLNGIEMTGKFYDSELLRIQLPPDRIIRIIKTTGMGKNKKFYVLLANGEKKWTNTIQE